jgi:hypothetical protein
LKPVKAAQLIYADHRRDCIADRFIAGVAALYFAGGPKSVTPAPEPTTDQGRPRDIRQVYVDLLVGDAAKQMPDQVQPRTGVCRQRAQRKWAKLGDLASANGTSLHALFDSKKC